MNRYLFNPYTRVAGLKSLAVGIVGLAAIAYVSFKTGTHQHGLLVINFANDSTLTSYALEHIISWFSFALPAFIIGSIISKTRVRAMDFLGTSLMARLPLIVVPALRFVPIFHSFAFLSAEMLVLVCIYIVMLIWTAALLFNGFKVSSNLKSNKLVLSFILSMVISEIITGLTIIFINP